MKKILCLLFFISLFLFILPQPANAIHLPGCGSACGAFGCKPNEEFCDDFANDEEFCASVPRCPASTPTPTTKPPSTPTPTPAVSCSNNDPDVCDDTLSCAKGLRCDCHLECASGTCNVNGFCTAVPVQTSPTPTPICLQNGVSCLNTQLKCCPSLSCDPAGPAGAFTCSVPIPVGTARFDVTIETNPKGSPPPGQVTFNANAKDNLKVFPVAKIEIFHNLNFSNFTSLKICVATPPKLSGLDCSVSQNYTSGNVVSYKTRATDDKGNFKESPTLAFTVSDTPTPTPTPIPPLSPCAKWVYDFPKDNPDSRLNGQTISPSDLKNVDSKNIKCAALNTAIGPIGIEPKEFVARIFGLVLGLSAGISLILIIISGYKFMTTGGNPESFNAAKDMLVSAIAGLLFIIFAFVILQIIGVDILRIPGFG